MMYCIRTCKSIWIKLSKIGIHETPPAYAGGIILGQAKLVLNLHVLDTLYSAVSLPRLLLLY